MHTLFTPNQIDNFRNWYATLQSKSGIRNQNHPKEFKTEREMWIAENSCPIAKDIIQSYEDGYGFKTIAANLGISYTNCRNLLQKYLRLETRKGINVVTDVLKKIRSENATGEKSNWFDWANRKPWMQEKTTRSIQGYYKSKNGEYVWLRSTYEYIYAKWLDDRNISWKTEVESYSLKNGERYRPDFFLYSDLNTLQAIVEIKSNYYNENRAYKYFMFKEEYPNIHSSIIFDINVFTKKGYHQEIKQWKQERLSREKLKKLK
jgi:hypothetical protein